MLCPHSRGYDLSLYYVPMLADILLSLHYQIKDETLTFTVMEKNQERDVLTGSSTAKVREDLPALKTINSRFMC